MTTAFPVPPHNASRSEALGPSTFGQCAIVICVSEQVFVSDRGNDPFAPKTSMTEVMRKVYFHFHAEEVRVVLP